MFLKIPQRMGLPLPPPPPPGSCTTLSTQLCVVHGRADRCYPAFCVWGFDLVHPRCCLRVIYGLGYKDDGVFAEHCFCSCIIKSPCILIIKNKGKDLFSKHFTKWQYPIHNKHFTTIFWYFHYPTKTIIVCNS